MSASQSTKPATAGRTVSRAQRGSITYCRRTHQGAYVFNWRRVVSEIGEIVSELHVFADSRREATPWARAMADRQLGID